MSWTSLRDALQAAVVSASGLASDHVVWGFQNVNAPSLPYIEISIGPVLGVGQDGILESYDVGRPAGQEFKLELLGVRELPLEIACFSESVADSSDALAMTEKIRGGFHMPTLRAVLAAQGIAPFDLSQPANFIPEVVSTGFRGRGQFPIRCYAPAQDVHEFVGYIETVKGTLTIHGGNEDPIEIGMDFTTAQAVYDDSPRGGQAHFDNEFSIHVVLDPPRSNDRYRFDAYAVGLNADGTVVDVAFTNLAADGFDLEAPGLVTLDVDWHLVPL